MSIIRVSELDSTSNITSGSQFLVSYGDSDPRVSKHISFADLKNNISQTYSLFAQTNTSTTISGTTIESSIIGSGVGGLSVPANAFSIGDSFRGDISGVFSTANNETIRFRVKSGSIVLLDSGEQTISNVSNDVYTLIMNFTIRNIGGTNTASIVSLGRFQYSKTVNGTIEGFSFNTINNTTFDTTASNTLDITVQFGSTSGNNKIYSDLFVLNKIR